MKSIKIPRSFCAMLFQQLARALEMNFTYFILWSKLFRENNVCFFAEFLFLSDCKHIENITLNRKVVLMFEENWGAEISILYIHLQFVEKQKLALKKSAQSLV